MQNSIQLKEEIFKKLQLKSKEVGINPNVLANNIIEENLNKPIKMVRLSDSFEELIGFCDYPEPSDAVELKHWAYERGL